MRSGNRRGVTLALGLLCALAVSAPCRGELFPHTIPDLVPAVDVNTGGPYLAPPIPYGHYTGKNCGGKVAGLLHGGLGGLGGLFHKGVCANCGGAGCDQCGKGGHGGHGGLFHHGGGGYGGTYSDGNGSGFGGGHFHQGGADCHGHASTATICPPQGIASGQSPVIASEQCVDPGCGLFARHRHKGCGSCSGRGCHKCATYDPCAACGGKGCGLCRGGGTGCFLCGGKGCAVCGKALGLVNHLLHRDKIEWFVGPGGPVPLTPGYVPYVVVTRSPRDFFSFPPMNPFDP